MTHVLRILFLLVIAALAACTTSKPIELTQTKYVWVEPDTQLIQDCPQVTPPEEEVYVSADPKQREALLIDLSLQQMDTIAKCNKQWGTLREWNAKQRGIYSDKK